MIIEVPADVRDEGELVCLRLLAAKYPSRFLTVLMSQPKFEDNLKLMDALISEIEKHGRLQIVVVGHQQEN